MRATVEGAALRRLAAQARALDLEVARDNAAFIGPGAEQSSKAADPGVIRGGGIALDPVDVDAIRLLNVLMSWLVSVMRVTPWVMR